MYLQTTAISLLFLILSLAFNRTDTEYYLICTGKFSKSHHKDYKSPSQYCRGLNSFKAEIKRLETSEAISERSDPCNFCFGNQPKL